MLKASQRGSGPVQGESVTGKREASGRQASAARKTTPAQALAATKKRLQQKQEHDRGTQPWQALDSQPGHVPEAGFQSDQAAEAAQQLHDGESRKQAIQGSAGTRDRRSQGQRDKR